jgi:hypothetical protein
VLERGHGAGANLDERVHTSALEWTYFAMKHSSASSRQRFVGISAFGLQLFVTGS